MNDAHSSERKIKKTLILREKELDKLGSGFQMEKIVRTGFNKPYDEEYARLCILRYFPCLALCLEVNEKDPPDLIDKRSSVGIEVVRAISQVDAERENRYYEFLHKKEFDIEGNLINKIEKNGGRFRFDPESGLVGTSGSVKDNLYQLIGERIVSKTKKLNKSNYGKGLSIKYDYLFIYNSGGFCFERDLGESIDKIYEEALVECPRKYTKIIIYCDHDIFLYDVLEHKVVHKSISDEEIEEMKGIAVQHVNQIHEL